LQKGELEEGLVTSDLKAYFTPEAIADFAASLGPLGAPSGFSQTASEGRGGMTFRSFSIQTSSKSLNLSTYLTPDGKYAQFLISPAPKP
jgi:hypothetical protein